MHKGSGRAKDKLCLLCNFVFSFVCIVLEVSHIRDVTDIAYLVAEVLEQFHEHVVCHAWSRMSQVCVSIYGRTTDIKSYVTLVYWLEDLFLSRKRIGYI